METATERPHMRDRRALSWVFVRKKHRVNTSRALLTKSRYGAVLEAQNKSRQTWVESSLGAPWNLPRSQRPLAVT